MRGDCPVGGVKVTGYVTPAGRYCAITGGTYTIIGNSGADDEHGTCTFRTAASATHGTTTTPSVFRHLPTVDAHDLSGQRPLGRTTYI